MYYIGGVIMFLTQTSGHSREVIACGKIIDKEEI